MLWALEDDQHEKKYRRKDSLSVMGLSLGMEVGVSETLSEQRVYVVGNVFEQKDWG